MTWRHSLPVRLASTLGLALALLFCAEPRLHAELAEELGDANPDRIRLGWEGNFVLGAWTILSADVAISEPGRYRLVVAASDPDGNLAEFAADEVNLPAGAHRLYGSFQLGGKEGEIRARVERNGEPWLDLSDQMASLVRHPRLQSERLLITVGLPADLRTTFPEGGPGEPTAVHFDNPSTLPTHELAYDGVMGLLLTGRNLPNEAQSAAIDDWVRRGGRLYLSLGMPPAEFRAAPIARRIPLEIAADLLPTRELTSLETYAGKSVRIVPPGQRVLIPKIAFATGRTLAGHRAEPMLVEVPLGLGSVTLLGMDVTQAPLAGWVGAPDLLRRMTSFDRSSENQPSQRQQLGSSGITDIASQIAAAQEEFESVSRISPWWVIGGLFVVLALVGPLDYWLVDRLWKRPLGTWISFPIFLAASAAVAVWAAGSNNGTQPLLNQLDIFDYDAAAEFVRAQHWMTLYSPQTRRHDLQCRPRWTNWSAGAAAPSQLALGWSGLPESTFGGMYGSNSSGLQFGQTRYEIASFAGLVSGLPTAQWSTSELTAESSGRCAGLVESTLESTASGRLSGTVLHHLPGDLADWFLAYENRIYRMPEEDSDEVRPLAAQQVFRIDQRSVIQRELRGYLTRTRAQHVGGAGKMTGSNQLVVQQTDYDPLSRDLARILPLLSFHAEAGGKSYTGLRNDMRAELDLTPLLDLDRAVLIGFLQAPAAEMLVDGGAAPSGRRLTLVRLVLPVERTQKQLGDLPKFDDR
jgi:hypothetical protein